MTKQTRRKPGCVKPNPSDFLDSSAQADRTPEQNAPPYTAEQWKVIQSRKTVVKLIAGAGTGKTTALCGRAEYWVGTGSDHKRILFLALTNSAVKNCQERLDSIDQCSGVRSLTFHSLCLQFIRAFPELAHFTSAPDLFKASDQKQCLKELIKQVADAESIPVKQLRSAVSAMQHSQHLKLEGAARVRSAAKKVLAELRKYKTQHRVLSYDDMLSKVVKLVKKDPAIADRLAPGIEHLMVDELQDIGQNEVELLYALATRVRSTTLVGDRKQGIFSFRGADPACWDDLEARLEQHFNSQFKRYYLTKSMRVPTKVLALANAVGQDICDDPPLTGCSKGLTPVVFVAKDAEAQGQFINNQIGILTDSGVDPSQIAILGRTRKSLFYIKNQLTNFGRNLNEDYRVSEAESEKALRALIRITRRLYQNENARMPRKSLQRLIDYLDLPTDAAETLFKTTLQQGWQAFHTPKKTGGKEVHYKGIKQIREQVLRAKNFDPEAGSQLLIDALNRFIVRRYRKDAASIRQDLSRLKLRLREYAAWDEIDLRDIDLAFTNSGVNLYTIHGAKGREWDYVFVINVVDGYLPFKPMGNSGSDEELRVFYTAVTRTKKGLYLIESPILITRFAKKSTNARGFKKKADVRRKRSPYIKRYLKFMKEVDLSYKPKKLT